VGQAVDRGCEALAVLFPSEAGKVRLLNGDMVTPAALGACMERIDARLDQMGAELVGINQRLDRMDAYPRRWLYVGLLLGVLLIVAQVGTPFLEALVVARRQGPGARGQGPGDRGQETGGVFRHTMYSASLRERNARPTFDTRSKDVQL